ncbi:hypothetical protein ACWCXH_14330 [Kitasatospora sp. NPDC001660]
MNIDQALANARTRLAIGWPLLVLALALYAPADGVTRIVLLLVGAALAAGKLPASTPASKVRKTTSPTATKASTVPPQRKGGDLDE